MWSTKDRLVGDELFCLTCDQQNKRRVTDGLQNTAEKRVVIAPVGLNSRLGPEWSGNVSSVATGSPVGDL